MNIMFLDFDRVFLTSRTKFKTVDRVATDFLKEQCEKYEIKIIVSSTHRLFERCLKTLDDAGLRLYLVPVTKWKTDNLSATHRNLTRGFEIEKWLSEHSDSVSNYIIIDDDLDMLDHHLRFLVRTSETDGILTEHMLKFIDIIENEWKVTP